LDVPIAGRIDDPKFKVGPIIWHVVVNLIEKAATSPFSLLGAVFGGGEELSFVSFEPGHAEIPESEIKKLDTLAKALYERPSLNVEITGSADPGVDRVALARVRLDQQIRSLWIKEQTDSGKPAVAVEDVKLEPAEYERLLKKTYKKVLGRYKPTEVATNQTSGPGGSSIAEQLAAMPKLPASDRGATLLMTPAEPAKAVTTTTSLPSGSPIAVQSSVPKTRTELELADMQEQLVQKIEITNDDLRDLMQARAAKVQAFLLKTEKVTAERVFIIAPKPVDAAFKGQDRVNLSLD
jgi:hypothetical protein